MVSKLIINDLFWWIIYDKYFLGWRRELVYRTSGETADPNGARYMCGDVYYYSPSNKKLRSLREIQEQLNISSDKNALSIECFTLLKQPIGMNDKSKELIRNAKVIKIKLNMN